MLTEEQIKAQSLNCYAQWSEQWRSQAKYHGDRFVMKPLTDFEFSGIGKAALLVGNGYSFEENLETIKRYQDNVDVVACDKTLQHCIETGITPKCCILCDANVSFERYCRKVSDRLFGTTLIANVCAATEWATLGNWKDVYFFINKDCLQSEQEFQEISACPNIIVAGTNVSNAMIIMLTQCDNARARNFFGYDKLLLIGFDYCWDDDSYYAFDRDGGGKKYYMNNILVKTIDQNLCYTSSNLAFSAKWLESYLQAFKINAVQCSKRSILPAARIGTLEEEMKYRYREQDVSLVRRLVSARQDALDKIKGINQQIQAIGLDHAIASSFS